jgi:hypothetical protein
MAVLRTDIERALDDLVSNEGGMRFQGLAVVLGRMRWPELIAHERKKDFGLDAYARASLTREKIGKGLASSITPTLEKISEDVRKAKEHFADLGIVLFVTSARVFNPTRSKWEEAIEKEHGLELHVISREDIITTLMMPENAGLCAGFLYLDVAAAPQVADLIARTKSAAADVAATWAARLQRLPLMALSAVRLDLHGAESTEVFSLDQIGASLSESRRIVLEAPAGRGKTTTLIQLAQRESVGSIGFMVDLPAWTASRRTILEYLAALPSFQAHGVAAADLSRVQESEAFRFLLNGWNEIAASSSEQASDALRELERVFPKAGVIVATRTHHLTPPLPGALRLRLLQLRRQQRADYLSARLGAKAAELRKRLDADPSLDELTRSPFILSEVAALFEAGVAIPDTKVGVLGAVVRLQEEGEHRNALQAAPLFGRQTDYLEAFAAEMTRRGAVSLLDAEARAIAITVGRDLVERLQIAAVPEPTTVVATLTAHHLLERIDYPETMFRFEHQQFQEHYAALGVRARLLDLREGDDGAQRGFTVGYVNEPVWAEPLRMVAETLAGTTGDADSDRRSIRGGRRLVEMALTVDPIFAAELAQLCGAAAWGEVRGTVGTRLRTLYAVRDDSYRQCALAGMLATGSDDFRDIVVPLLSGKDRQVRLRVYRLWPRIQVTCLGPDWREQVRSWSEEARTDCVSELLHYRLDAEVAAFAVADQSPAVKKAAVSALLWIRSEDAATRVLESMDEQTFEDVARENADRMPAALRAKTIAAMRKAIESTTDHAARLRTALDLIECGETGLDGVVKDAMMALPSGNMRNLGSHDIQPALEYLRRTDPVWTSEWVATQVAEGVLHAHEDWLPFATAIPDRFVEKNLRRLETEDFKNRHFDGVIAVIAARADADLAARVFTKLRELRRKVDAEPGVRHEFEWQVLNQLEAVFRRFPDDVGVAGVLASVTSGDPLDTKVAADLFSRVARSDVEPMRIADADLKGRLRAYLTGSVDLVLRRDDFNGEEKANLASSIAQVGEPEDMAGLVTLIRADIERMRRGRAARAAGDQGPLGNGGTMSYAGWHIAAVTHLDPAGADQVLIDLLPEPEYLSDAAAAMARDFVPKQERSFDRRFRYDLMWAAREGRVPPPGDDHRRTRFAAALNAEIRRLRGQLEDGKPAAGLKELAKALAAVDGRGSAAAVVDTIALPGQWDQYIRLDAAERLLMAGVVLPATTAFALVDSILERTGKWMQDSDRYLLQRILALCPFVDDPAAGIAKMRDVLGERRCRGYELRELVTALGESRCDAAVDLLCELASDTQTFEQCGDNVIKAFATLDTPRARELLVGFVDPDVRGLALRRRPDGEDMLVARIVELARCEAKIAMRLRELCERDLPELNRHVLSKVMDWLGTPEAVVASLNLIDDSKSSPVPQGIRDQLEGAFVERRSYGESSSVFTQHARASNELRTRLFRMATEDERRRKSAYALLGQIEEWRLEHGRPAGEPRHPDFASGQPWPPLEPDA